MNKKISEEQVANRPQSDLRPLAEILINWWNRREAEWRANGVSEEIISKISKKLKREEVKPK